MGYTSIRACIYPLQQYTDGTHSSILTAGRQAKRRKTEVKGVKGVSPLVPYMDLVISIPVGYMHSVLEGVTQMLLNQWFDSKHCREQYYLGRAVSTIVAEATTSSGFSHPPHSCPSSLLLSMYFLFCRQSNTLQRGSVVCWVQLFLN